MKDENQDEDDHDVRDAKKRTKGIEVKRRAIITGLTVSPRVKNLLMLRYPNTSISNWRNFPNFEIRLCLNFI